MRGCPSARLRQGERRGEADRHAAGAVCDGTLSERSAHEGRDALAGVLRAASGCLGARARRSHIRPRVESFAVPVAGGRSACGRPRPRRCFRVAGTWWYQVRGINESLAGNQIMSWSSSARPDHQADVQRRRSVGTRLAPARDKRGGFRAHRAADCHDRDEHRHLRPRGRVQLQRRDPQPREQDRDGRRGRRQADGDVSPRALFGWRHPPRRAAGDVDRPRRTNVLGRHGDRASLRARRHSHRHHMPLDVRRHARAGHNEGDRRRCATAPAPGKC